METARPSRGAFRARLVTFLAVLGPGLIAAAAGNEAGGIVTYSHLGAAHGLSMLWLLMLSTFSLIVAQEMGTRMALVTGKGLADLIREEYGVRVAVFAMLILFIANLATTISELAGIRAALGMVLNPGFVLLLLPVLSTLLWLLVTRGTYRRVERVFLGMCSVYVAYIVAAFIARPDWGAALHATVTPQFPRHDPTYIRDAIQLIGTTVAPWMQFYIQSSVRDKGTRREALAESRLDVFMGSTLSNVISFFIVVACATTLPALGIHAIATAGDAAQALRNVGPLGFYLFAIGLFNASAVGAVVVPLSTAYAVTEAIGSESGLGRQVREAPLFIGIFSALLAIGTVTVLLTPERGLVGLISVAQIINGILLPVILWFMLRLINSKRLMGKHTNGIAANIVAWATVALVIVLSIASLFLISS
jgi:Mn2+/Fe2+ NRAMP family transporter